MRSTTKYVFIVSLIIFLVSVFLLLQERNQELKQNEQMLSEFQIPESVQDVPPINDKDKYVDDYMEPSLVAIYISVAIMIITGGILLLTRKEKAKL
ncbi:hypothetical protein [Caldalkalibacillus mannanilyticus]|uniref:hypothetical protein n=1 Tax=Caldalkalibacillus mannanilyticus TaxID=1418 RepID=UPI00046854D3|nr:hypothetical protein [Caldalkalibacillus mannanilyticus]